MELRDITPIPTVPSALIYPKKSKWKPVVLAVLVVGVVCVGLWYAMPRMLSLFFSGDEQSKDGSKLALSKVTVPDRSNGYFSLSKLTNETVFVPESNKNIYTEYTNYAKPVSWNQNLVDSVLQKNAQPLAALSDAASKQYFQFPKYADPGNIGSGMEQYPLEAYEKLARIQAIQALSLARQGKTNEALAEAAKLTTLGHHIIVGHNSLPGNMLGIAVQRLGSETMLQILQLGSPGKGALLNALKKVDESSTTQEGYADAVRFEYAYVVGSIGASVSAQLQRDIDRMATEGFITRSVAKYAKHGYYYKPNQTKDLFTELFTAELSRVGQECTMRTSTGSKAHKVQGWRTVFTENVVGKLLFSAYDSSLGGVFAKQCQNDLALNVAKAELGLALYKVDHGVVPASLDKIVPDYMPALPTDPYSKQPLHYNAKDKLLYSVGEKKQDLGGSSGEDWAAMENPTFHFSF